MEKNIIKINSDNKNIKLLKHEKENLRERHSVSLILPTITKKKSSYSTYLYNDSPLK
jgi:hypothetical protein